VLALGLVKPHLFVLVPVALLLQRRYRTLLTLSGACAGLVPLTLPVVGLQTRRDWLAALASPLYTAEAQVGQTAKMQSLSGLATAFGAPPALAYVVLLVGVVALVLQLRSCRYNTAQVWSATVLTTLVFSPHVMIYDLVLLLPVLALAHARPTRLLAVALVVVLFSVPLREAGAQAAPSWSFLAYPWSALLLLALWLLIARVRGALEDQLDEPLRSGTGGG
jgi:hypothetical protein